MIQRIEKKYPFSGHEHFDIQAFLTRSGFNLANQSRFVTSLYFDFPSLSLFTDSEEGLTPRYKTRLRWYGQEFLKLETGIFEIKRTLSNKREKISLPVSSGSSSKFYEWQKIKTGELRPILFVRYFRHYYSDADSNRATVDVDIRYSLFRPLCGREIYQPIFVARDSNSVMELKLSNLATSITLLDNVPLTTTRFSKYCQGISLLTGRAH